MEQDKQEQQEQVKTNQEVSKEQANANSNWLDEEVNQLEQNSFGEQLPSLKLEEGKVTEFEVDVSKPFGQWQDPQTKTVKKILPVTQAGVKLNFWLNVQNPAYKEIVLACKAGQTKFKILRTGSMKSTRYTLVKN